MKHKRAFNTRGRARVELAPGAHHGVGAVGWHARHLDSINAGGAQVDVVEAGAPQQDELDRAVVAGASSDKNQRFKLK